MAFKLLVVFLASSCCFLSSLANSDTCGDGEGQMPIPPGCEAWSYYKISGHEDQGLLREFNLINSIKMDQDPKYNTLVKVVNIPGMRDKRLPLITHLFGDLIRSDNGISIGQFGPVVIRNDKEILWQDFKNIPGYLKRNGDNSYLRFFMPKLDRVEIYYDRETNNEFNHKLGSLDYCCDMLNTQCCEPAMVVNDRDSPVSLSIYPKNVANLTGALSNVILDLESKPKRLNFEYDGGESDSIKFEFCTPKVYAILYESTPRDKRFNDEIRPILAKVSDSLLAKEDQATNIRTIASTFSFELGEQEEKGGFYEGQIKFLNKNKELTPPINEFYEGWNKNNGLSVAFTVCECLTATESRSCREYVHKTVDEIKGL